MKTKPSEPILSVLVIGGSADSLLVISALKSTGFQVVLADKNPLCPARQQCDIFERASTFDYELLRRITKKRSIFYCVTRSTGIAARNCFRLNEILTNGRSSCVADSLLDKSKLANFCLANHIPYPMTHIADLKKEKETLSFPIVIKPIYEKIGKTTTFKINCLDDFKDAVSSSDSNSHVNQSVIQEYLEGNDFSLLGYARKKEYVPIGLYREENEFICGMVKHRGFSLCRDVEPAPFLAIAATVAAGLNPPLSPLNLGFRVFEGKVFLLEVNLDFGGEGILDKISLECAPGPIEKFLSELKNTANSIDETR